MQSGQAARLQLCLKVVEWSLGIVELATAKPSLVGNDAVRASKALEADAANPPAGGEK
jgi:hypothetical protein